MKRTYQPSKTRRQRRHGFLVRMRTRGGRAVINARRAKGRTRLSAEGIMEAERQSLEFLPPTQTQLPGAGYLQFQQNLNTLAPAQ